MLADQFTAAAAAARNTAAVDEIARLTWRAHAEGQLADAEAEAVSEALQARRAAFATRGTVSPSRPALGLPRPARSPRSPDRQASIERRRRQAMSGVVPAKIAASFTMAELAVLTVIARQCQRAGVCVLPIDAIAALAGCSPNHGQERPSPSPTAGPAPRQGAPHPRPEEPDQHRHDHLEGVDRLAEAAATRGIGGQMRPTTDNHLHSKKKSRRGASCQSRPAAWAAPTAYTQRKGM